MYSFKVLSLFFLIVLSGFNLQNNRADTTRWVITRECFLKVGGSTNVNTFNCVIAKYYRPDTLTLFRGSGEPVKISGQMELNVEDFDCHNPIMTSDLRKTLKAKEFPSLTIKFVSMSSYPGDKDHPGPVNGVVSIGLAGVTKRFNVNYRFVESGSGSLTLIGTQQVHFSDFNIIPPRKLGGMIQTNNQLNVEFNLKVKILD